MCLDIDNLYFASQLPLATQFWSRFVYTLYSEDLLTWRLDYGVLFSEILLTTSTALGFGFVHILLSGNLLDGESVD